jgi:hypothetical protein
MKPVIKGLDEKTLKEILNEELKIGVFVIWCLGIKIFIGGQYFSWNFGLTSRIWELSYFYCGDGYFIDCSSFL